MMLLDERRFQDERFHFRLCLDNFHVHRFFHHRRYLNGPIAILAHVGLYAITKVHGFAYIDDALILIMPQVYTGRGRQIGDF